MSTTALKVITEAQGYPITLSEAKAHLRITHSYEDEYIQSLIAAATKWAEDMTGRIFADTEVEIAIDDFPECNLYLPGGTITAVNEIRYTDENGAAQTLTGPTSTVPGTDYQENLYDDQFPFVRPARDSEWPSVQDDLTNAVIVNYQVGWNTSRPTPENVLIAIKLFVGALFVERDGEPEKTAGGVAAKHMLFPYIIQEM